MEKSALIQAGDTERPAWQEARLAELVLHLTDCSADEALSAVTDPVSDDAPAKLDNDAALERVARAIVQLRK